jgi:long-chain acyl-CoA synthetase
MAENDKPWFHSWPSDVPRTLTYPDVALHEILRNTAREHGEKTAISFRDKEITYAELNELSNRFAASLASLGVARGDRIAIYLPNIPQFIIAYFGVLKAGAVVTTISPLHREREVERQLSDSGTETIVTLDSLYSIVANVWSRTRMRNVVITSIEAFDHSIGKKPNAHSFQQLLTKSADVPNVKFDPAEDLAALQYTGGTTGTAKGAMLTHRNLVANAVSFATWIRGTAEDTFLTALPLFHIYGMTTSMNAPISLAAKMVLLPRFDSEAALVSIQRNNVTVFCGVPTMYTALLGHPSLNQFTLTSIRVCISGASPLPSTVQKQFMEITGGLLAEGYGLTEASPVTHCSPVDRITRNVRVGSIGLPLPDTEARIIDLETGTETLGSGEAGELAVKGPQVMKGYWRNPEETALVLRGGWLLTGDIARIDGEGYFYISDRKKDLIKYKDYSVYPRELEDVLYEHPAVRLCAVVGKPDRITGEIPKAFIVLKEHAKVTHDEIKQFVRERVAPYKQIREVDFRGELPLSSTGKVLKRVLQEQERNKAMTSF